jgi:hypothetical protein
MRCKIRQGSTKTVHNACKAPFLCFYINGGIKESCVFTQDGAQGVCTLYKFRGT